MLGKVAIAVTFPGCMVGFRLRWLSVLSHQKLAVAFGGFLKLLRFVLFSKVGSWPRTRYLGA